MAKNDSPLALWLRAADASERERCARLAGTTVNYLYALAGGHREVPKANLAFNIEDATRTLHDETSGRLPVVAARELAFMHALTGLTTE